MLPEQQQRIMGYFIEEAKDHLNTIEQGLLNLQATIEDPEMANEVFRAAHSVKGGAAMLGLESIQRTAHRMEDYFKVLKESPIRVDRTLESMFLQVFDTLQELLEQLQGPFGLTDDKAESLMAEVEPVFGQLEAHLDSLVQATEAKPAAAASQPQAVVAPTARRASTQEGSALQLVFKSDVSSQLREMLGLFKRADTDQSRQALQAICQQLEQLGDPFELDTWSDLVSTARLAIANPENDYRTLAPVVIKEIKAAQELVLASRAPEISVSQTLQSLLPEDTVLAPELDDLDADLLDSTDALGPDALGSDDLGDLFEEVSLGEAVGEDDAISPSTATADLDMALDLSALDTESGSGVNNLADLGVSDLDAAAEPLGADPTGPEVGAAELNSLADLFEGDLGDLDEPWQEEEISLEAADSAIDVDISGDFADLLEPTASDYSELDSGEELADLFGDALDSSSDGEDSSSLGEDDFDLDLDLADAASAPEADLAFDTAFDAGSLAAEPELNSLGFDEDSSEELSRLDSELGLGDRPDTISDPASDASLDDSNLDILDLDTEENIDGIETDELEIGEPDAELTSGTDNADSIIIDDFDLEDFSAGLDDTAPEIPAENNAGLETELTDSSANFSLDLDGDLDSGLDTDLGPELDTELDAELDFERFEGDTAPAGSADLPSETLDNELELDFDLLDADAALLDLSGDSEVIGQDGKDEVEAESLTDDLLLDALDLGDPDVLEPVSEPASEPALGTTADSDLADFDLGDEFADPATPELSDELETFEDPFAGEADLADLDLGDTATAAPFANEAETVDVDEASLDLDIEGVTSEDEALDDLWVSSEAESSAAEPEADPLVMDTDLSALETEPEPLDMPAEMSAAEALVAEGAADADELMLADFTADDEPVAADLPEASPLEASEASEASAEGFDDFFATSGPEPGGMAAASSIDDFFEMDGPETQPIDSTFWSDPVDLPGESEAPSDTVADQIEAAEVEAEAQNDFDLGSWEEPVSETLSETSEEAPELQTEQLQGRLSGAELEADLWDDQTSEDAASPGLDEMPDLWDDTLPASAAALEGESNLGPAVGIDMDQVEFTDELELNLNFDSLDDPEDLTLDLAENLPVAPDASSDAPPDALLDESLGEEGSDELAEFADVASFDASFDTSTEDEAADLGDLDALLESDEAAEAIADPSADELGLDELALDDLGSDTSALDGLALDDLDTADAAELDSLLGEDPELAAESGLLEESEASELGETDVEFDLSSDALSTDDLSTDDAPTELFDAGFDALDPESEAEFGAEFRGELDAETVDADDFEDLDALLADSESEAAETFPDLGSEPTAGESDFADLDALLDDPATAELAGPADGQTDEQADFADLDALLADDEFAGESVTADADLGDAELDPTEAAIAAPASDTDTNEFEDLEKLLEEADQSLGGPTGVPMTRRVVPAPNRARRAASVLNEQTMRVSVKHLDNLSNLVGELVVNRNTLEQDQERLRQFLDNLLFQVQQLNDVGQRMRDLYERSLLESSLISSRQSYQMAGTALNPSGMPTSHATGETFDALEMDRFTGFHTLSQEMIELIVRVRESASDIGYTVDSADQVTRQFRQVTTQLQEGLNKARMVPFAQTADRLPRAVRDISLKCGKEARLVVEGRDTLIDKMILEQLYDPMTHLVNNAITHGVETPEERKAAGKSAEGAITVRAFYQGNQTVIYVADDGGGIDPELVKQKAVKKGLISPAEARSMSMLDVYELLFHPGFSTRDQADDFAGRGVGMDVVRTSLTDIRGSITIDSELGKGTSFTIRLPLTLSISKALSCISNQARIAFPMDGVEDMFDVPRERIQHNERGEQCILWRDTLLPFQPLSELLKFNRTLGRGRVYGGHQDDDVISIVVLRSASTYIALEVDQVIGEQEIVIKQLEGPVPKPVGIAGATVLGDGRVMPIADVLELIDLAMGRVRREPSAAVWSQAEELPPEEPVTGRSEPTVLIVDDSITVRELLSMSFNKVGYRVEQARDGQEAWEKMRAGLPCDLVFCDIEMPRMDGLELLSRMQKDNALKRVPIAMLTSRGADRHRQMAVDLGASGYFTKPYLEEALLDAAQRMLSGEKMT